VRVLAALLGACALTACSAGDEATSGSAEAPGGTASAAACPSAEERRPTPELKLPDLHGNPVELASFKGKTVVIDFWATWCPPCEFQIPVLNAVYEAHRASGLVVLGVSVDVEGREVVAPYVEQHGVRYPILLGSEAVARAFGVPGFPALVVVAPDGTMAPPHPGLIEQEELEHTLACLRAAGRA
jgi:thiol-disulfide isomerase/thioredoxin